MTLNKFCNHHYSSSTTLEFIVSAMPSTNLLPITLLLTVVTGAAAAGNTSFTFNGFTGANLTLFGQAEISDTGLLQMTNETQQVLGQAFLRYPLHLKIGNSSALSFSTTFVYAIVPKHPDTFGHGIAFVLSPTKDLPFAQPSRDLGVFNDTIINASDHIVAVELDTVKDVDVGDINNNHVGIDVNGLRSVNSTNASYYVDQIGYFKDLSLASGNPMNAWIEYDGGIKEIRATISPLDVPKPSVPLLTFSIDLTSILLSNVFVGFSSSTGSATSSHYILGWSFCVNGEATPLDKALLPLVPSVKYHKNLPMILVVVLTLIATIVAVLVIYGLVVMVMRRRKKFAEILEDWEVEYGPHRFSYRMLYKSTGGFHDNNIIGSGGFGVVYRGVLKSSKMDIAVKKVSHGSRQGMKEFVAEIASMGRLRHRNLVKLLGYCRREGELLLVYDYMPNGSLDKFLFFADGTSSPVLNWEQRFLIIRDVAAGLLYLHEGWEQIVVHRDIKSANVLLDGEMNGKLSDFGLARLYDHGSNPQTTRVVGTLGYLAPELMKTGKATTASDVYAFGIFLLEVASGRRPVEANPSSPEAVTLVDWVLEWWNKGALMEAVDPKLRGDYVMLEADMVFRLGLMCSHHDVKARPTLRQVVQILDGDAPMPPATPSTLKATSIANRSSEGFDDFVVSYPFMAGSSSASESAGRSSESARIALLLTGK